MIDGLINEYPYIFISLSIAIIALLSFYNIKQTYKDLFEDDNILSHQAYIYTWVVIIILTLILFEHIPIKNL
jgi:hypothetical protein